jgi:probable phosphoglycerate mutase
MSTFYLIRHGATDSAGHVLTGRTKGVHLNERGRKQADALPARFKDVPVKEIYATPLQRTQETAAPLAATLGLSVGVAEALTEVDYGDWTGKEVKSLMDDPLWLRFNSFRSSFEIPGGESMLQIQSRMTGFISSLHRAFPEQHIVLVSHGDPIKTAVAHYLGIHLDFFFRFVIDFASTTVITLKDNEVRVLTLNNRHDGLAEYIA